MAVFDFIKQNGIGAGFVYKNNNAGFIFDGTSFVQITDDDYPGVIPKSTLTRSGSTATFTSTTAHGLVTGNSVIISGATQTEYNGMFTVTVTSTVAFTFTVTGTPATPATGTVICTQVGSTVKGIVYLDGTYYVMTPNGAIYGSGLELPASWSALNVIQSRMEPDGGVCLARQLNLIVAFSEYSTEFFYDAGNATGSPLLPYASAFLEIGCASADSVQCLENSIIFIGVSKAHGRSVYNLTGTTPVPMSTASIDRIINADPLTNVSSAYIKLSGHTFYILVLKDTGITLVADVSTGLWSEWAQLTPATAVAVVGMSWSNGLVTVEQTAHGYSDGDCVTIAASNPIGYNGQYVINYVDANHYTYRLAVDPGTYIGTATASVFIETYFDVASYAYGSGYDLVQDSTTGSVYAISTSTYTDKGYPIKFQIRTNKFDAGNNKVKYFPRVEIIGDKSDSTTYLRYSNDDYQTWSNFRPIDMSAQRSKLDRLGKSRRRAFDMIHYDNTPVRAEALELTIAEGIS